MLLSYGAKIWLRISLCYVITTCYFLILRCLASQSSTLGTALYVPIAMVPPLYFATEYIAIEPIAITEKVTTPNTRKKVSSRDHSRLSLHVYLKVLDMLFMFYEVLFLYKMHSLFEYRLNPNSH